MNIFTMSIGPSIAQTRCIVSTEASLDQIRDAICACEQKTGINIFDICRVNDILDKELLSKLDQLGYEFPIELYKDELGTHILNPEFLLDLVLFLLHMTDPNLCITAQGPDIPEVFWVGTDEKGRNGYPVGKGLMPFA